MNKERFDNRVKMLEAYHVKIFEEYIIDIKKIDKIWDLYLNALKSCHLLKIKELYDQLCLHNGNINCYDCQKETLKIYPVLCGTLCFDCFYNFVKTSSFLT